VTAISLDIYGHTRMDVLAVRIQAAGHEGLGQLTLNLALDDMNCAAPVAENGLSGATGACVF
jgi:hypothetical protein